MSATNRGSNRHRQDAYITPPWAIRRFLEVYTPYEGSLLDPCAARGELLSVVKEMCPHIIPIGMEIRPECEEDLKRVTGSKESSIGDALITLANLPDKCVETVLTNFPFSLSEAFLRASIRVAKITITLQRINWLRGDGREALMRELNPGLFVLPQRPSFTGYGTDATEYAWFVIGDIDVAGRWYMLGDTPEEEIKEWNARAREENPWAKRIKKAA